MPRYQPQQLPSNLLTALEVYGAASRNECFSNAYNAVKNFTVVEKYVLGLIFFKSGNEESPVEHAWVKIGNTYHDPTPLNNKTHGSFRYAPIYECSKTEIADIILSMHTVQECALIKAGKFNYFPPQLKDVRNYKSGKTTLR